MRFAFAVAVFTTLALGVAGCNESPEDTSCADIASQLAARTPSISRTCSAPSDCMNVGHPQARNGQPSCGGGIAFLTCPGTAVNTAAWTTDEVIAPLFEQWQTRCVPAGISSGAPEGPYDCAPAGVDCVAQQCQIAGDACFGPGDAGVD